MNLIRFATPIALGLLLLLPALVTLARRRLTPRAALVLRLTAAGLLILSLASPQLAGIGSAQAVIFAIDVSDSIPAESRKAAFAFVRAASSQRQPRDRIGVVLFGGNAVLEEAPTPDPRLAFVAQPDSHATDVAGAIRTSLLALPPAGGRIVLLTDGNANRGDLAEALALARSQGIEVSVVPLSPEREGEVLVDEVVAPDEVGVGERILVRVAMTATTDARVRLRVTEGESVIDRRTIQVGPGRTIVTLSRVAQAEGLLRYTAAITAEPDGTAANNRASALVMVRGAPTAWYVAGSPGPLARVLATQGVRIRAVAPEALPVAVAEYRGIAAVVLDDVPATRLSTAQMTALRDYVGQLGGGLLAVGGTHSYGVGGYAGTALEDVLPVSMDVRHRLAVPSMAIVLVIDTSGSMGAFGQQIAKVELAKETAQSVVELLSERDVIGVVAFDQEPRWLVRPMEARLRAQVMDQVSRVQAGGGTNMFPAIALATDYLRRSPAKVRHVIVLSDGQTDPGDFQGLVTRMAREKITISSVAIGADADEEIMRNVARWGGGRYYLARDLYTIPQILTEEALLASRASIVEERFDPDVVRTELLADLRPPALRGYIATAPKPASMVHLASHQDDPILATWQYGIGRAAAFTSDAAPRWAAEWMPWPDLTRFWSRLLRWVGRGVEELQVAVDRQGDGSVVIADAYTPGGDPIDGMQVEARVSGPGTRAIIPLVQTGPGRYEGRVGAGEPGEYTVTVVGREVGSARTAPRLTRTGSAGFVVPYSPELRDLTVNRALLAQISEATGGRALNDPKAAMAPVRTTRAAGHAWPAFAGAALGVFVMEIVLRRVPAVGYHLHLLAAGMLARIRRQPTPTELVEDRRYAEADRWKLLERDVPPPSESMEQAARLYIARLKATKRDEDEEGNRD